MKPPGKKTIKKAAKKIAKELDRQHAEMLAFNLEKAWYSTDKPDGFQLGKWLDERKIIDVDAGVVAILDNMRFQVQYITSCKQFRKEEKC